MTTERCSKTANCLIVGVFLMAMIATLHVPQPARADETNAIQATNGISIIDVVDPERATRIEYVLKIEGTLSTPSTTGTSSWNLKSSGNFVLDQRRFVSDEAGQFGIRAVRRFDTAKTDSVVGQDHKTSVVLPNQAAMIQIYGTGNQLLQLSPYVRLSRSQVDLLQIPCDPIVAAGLLPARNLRDQNEKWNADSWVIPMVAGVDAAVNQSAKCRLKSLTASEAIVEFEGTAEGAVVGSATNVTLKGELVFDRAGKFIRAFRAVQSEKRQPGPFSPGLNVEATI